MSQHLARRDATPMIASIAFSNFKVLRRATLPLSPFTLLIGANGSGKSTALQGLQAVAQFAYSYEQVITAGAEPAEVSIVVRWAKPFESDTIHAFWESGGGRQLRPRTGSSDQHKLLLERLRQIRVYSLDATAISQDVLLERNADLHPAGQRLVAVLDNLRDAYPERFEVLNQELSRWLPEFDRLLFTTPDSGKRGFQLRRRSGGRPIDARELSHGTLLALAMMTLAYLPAPPPIVCLEEPDRGIHPRLLRDVRDALYRLAYPADFGEDREPTQVIATTHSPFMLDLLRDHPEEIVIAQKTNDGATFERLSEREHIQEILGDVQLSEAWFSGILGGVPTEG